MQSPILLKNIGIDSIPTTIINGDKFFETGDLGWLDENKFLFFAEEKMTASILAALVSPE